MACIYKITNNVNDKVYVGQTIRPIEARLQQHKRDAKRLHESNIKLYNAMNKYGAENFQISVVEECDAEDLDEREIFHIEQFDSFANGYNTTAGGGGRLFVDDESVMRCWEDGMTMSDIVKETGHSAEYVKSRLNNNGITDSDIHERAYRTQSAKVKVEVHQYTLDGEYVCSYPSIWDAEEATGIHHSCINGVLCGVHYSAGFFQWSREKTDNIGKCPHQFCGTPRTVYQYTLDGDFVAEHKSFTQAAKAVGLKSILPIRRVCYGKAHTSRGFKWSLERHDNLNKSEVAV